ncbi:MAG: copper chaperone PCu(A)C [Actinomycetota bacterium]
MNTSHPSPSTTRRSRRLVLAPLAIGALAAGLVACGDDDDTASADDITIVDAWVREPASGQVTSAAYGTITNGGDEEITLVGASAPIDATIEIHETLMNDDGEMSMQERENGFSIAAGDTFTLEPGGPHVMFLDIEPTEIVDTIEVTYIFDNGAEVTVPAEVRVLQGGAMDDMDHGDMDHSDEDHDGHDHDDMDHDDMDHDDSSS